MAIHPCWTMLDDPKISRHPTTKDHLGRDREIHPSLSQHLRNAQANHKKFT